MLTSIFIPSLIIQLLPFIIFISSMWFMIRIRNNKDLLTMKVYGYSNIKIFSILAFTAFILGWLILLVVNPVSSSMTKYYEKTKSNYARDIEHLVTFNKNGLWIKENIDEGVRITTAESPDGYNLIDVNIFHLDKNYSLNEKINSKKVNIKKNSWKLEDVEIFQTVDGILKKKQLDNYEMFSIYDYEKINSLFKNFDTMSFLELIINYNSLIKEGYNKISLNQKLHSLLSFPFFLLLMTGIAAILTMNTLKNQII